MSSLTSNYNLTLPAAGDPVDINVLNNNTIVIDGLIHDLATASDRVTANAMSVTDQFTWYKRAWSNGRVELLATRIFDLAKAGFADLEVTLPDSLRLSDPYYITAVPTYRGPWTSELVNKASFTTKFKAAAPKIYCMPYQLSENKFRLYVWNLTGEQTQFSVNIQIVGTPS